MRCWCDISPALSGEEIRNSIQQQASNDLNLITTISSIGLGKHGPVSRGQAVKFRQTLEVPNRESLMSRLNSEHYANGPRMGLPLLASLIGRPVGVRFSLSGSRPRRSNMVAARSSIRTGLSLGSAPVESDEP